MLQRFPNLEQLQNPVRQVPNTKPLLFSGRRLFCSRGSRIVATSDDGRTFETVCTLQIPNSYRLASVSTLARRVTRTDSFRMREVTDGNHAYVFRGGIYIQNSGSDVAVCTMRIPRGSRPVSLETNSRGNVVFGEYFANQTRKEVHIYGSTDGGMNWNIVYTFEPGAIRHVHGISYDRWDDCYWICTGDYHNENRLIRASCDFTDVRTLRQGGQRNRFFALQVFENKIVAATDTPFESNYVFVIDKQTGEARQAIEVENSCFYTCVVGSRVFISTNAERSRVNDHNNSHIWMGHNSFMNWDRIISRPVDVVDKIGRLPGLRNGFFQHPHYAFPQGTNPGHHLVCYGLGLQGQHDALMFYDVRHLAQEEPVDLAKAA